MASTSTGPPWRFSILSDQILPANDDPYSKYLEQLYDRINKYLEQKIIASLRDENEPEPIHLQSKTLDSEANFLIRSEQIDPLFVAGGIQDSVQDHPPRVFEHFGKVFSNFNGRVLLLGEPGAGKTITLLQHTRDLVVQRWQNSSLPLPILGLIHTWDASNQTPISNWLATSYGSPINTQELIEQGKAVLLLDGLDELGGLRPADSQNPSGPKIDPRQRFLQNLPVNNQVLVTCRTLDFLEIKEKAPVNGIIKLMPLGDSQIRQYLHKQPELLTLVESDSDLKNWLSTPLLLSFFAFAYEGMDAESKEKIKRLKTASELREFIFNGYINQRFQHEERKARNRTELLPHTLEDVLSYLGGCALSSLVVFWKYDIETFPESMRPIVHESQYDKYAQPLRPNWGDGDTAGLIPLIYSDKTRSLIEFAKQLNFLLFSDDEFRFPHLLLRNHFAYMKATKRLVEMKPVPREITSGFFQEKQEKIRVGEGESSTIIQAIVALRILKDPRAIPFIKPYTEVYGRYYFGYHEEAEVSSEAEHTIRVLQSVMAEPSEKNNDQSSDDPLY